MLIKEDSVSSLWKKNVNIAKNEVLVFLEFDGTSFLSRLLLQDIITNLAQTNG